MLLTLAFHHLVDIAVYFVPVTLLHRTIIFYDHLVCSLTVEHMAKIQMIFFFVLVDFIGHLVMT